MLFKKFYKIAGVGVLLVMLGCIVDIMVLQKQLRSINAQQVNANWLLQSKHQALLAAKTEQSQYQAKLKQWSYKFSTGDILNAVAKAAVDSQVRLDIIEPQPNNNDEFFIMFPIMLKLSGQYKDLLVFINHVFKQPFFMAFEELRIQKKDNHDVNNELDMVVLLTAYRSKISATEHVDTKPVPISNVAIHLPANDIFDKSIGATNLFLWATKELSFLGIIKQGQNIYGFVSDPMGGTHQVMIGDKIGLKQRKIVAINDRGILTTHKADDIILKQCIH